MNISSSYWRGLAVETVQRPSDAAERILNLNLSRNVLWSAMLLVSVLNTILYTLTNHLVPSVSPLPAAFDSPFIILLIVAGGLVLSVHMLYWTGRAMGGIADLGDILILLVWLQCLRLCVQAATLILLLTAPVFASLLVLAAGIIGIWILAHFVNVAHRFGSVVKAAGVLVATVLGLLVGLSILLSLIGASILGSSAYV